MPTDADDIPKEVMRLLKLEKVKATFGLQDVDDNEEAIRQAEKQVEDAKKKNDQIHFDLNTKQQRLREVQDVVDYKQHPIKYILDHSTPPSLGAVFGSEQDALDELKKATDSYREVEQDAEAIAGTLLRYHGDLEELKKLVRGT